MYNLIGIWRKSNNRQRAVRHSVFSLFRTGTEQTLTG